ncbi:hypothetical protein BSLG_010413 [Batrachochytrium salamandrivorans]|nr:hypothetical protein BSLG_010413 [Batrachochytrium salamandrivorans]
MYSSTTFKAAMFVFLAVTASVVHSTLSLDHANGLSSTLEKRGPFPDDAPSKNPSGKRKTKTSVKSLASSTSPPTAGTTTTAKGAGGGPSSPSPSPDNNLWHNTWPRSSRRLHEKGRLSSSTGSAPSASEPSAPAPSGSAAPGSAPAPSGSAAPGSAPAPTSAAPSAPTSSPSNLAASNSSSHASNDYGGGSDRVLSAAESTSVASFMAAMFVAITFALV